MAVRIDNRKRSRKASGGALLPVALLGMCVVLAAWIGRGGRSELQAASSAPTIVAEFDTIDIPVPSRYVPAGTKVSDIELKKVAYPKHQIPRGALLSLDSFLHATAITPLPANLPMFEQNLSLTATSSNPVVERIPAGMRAMTVKVDATAAVEGWAGSGSIVDVLLVEKNRTSVVAEKVKILSAERSVSPVEGAASPNVPSTVTLLVTQEQCLAINTAIPLGRIAFALQGSGDSLGWTEVSYTAERLKGSPSVPRGQSSINGFAAIRADDGSSNSFALNDNRWVKTEVVPEGFLPSRERAVP